MTYPEGQGWHVGGPQGPAAPGAFYGEPGSPSWSDGNLQGNGGGTGNRALVAVLAVVAVVLVAVLGFLGYKIFSGGQDPQAPTVASTSTLAEEPAGSSEASTSSTESSASATGSPLESSAAPSSEGRFPEVQPAAELPADQKEKLGTEIQINTSDLRYREIDVFSKTYACLFTVDIANLSEEPRSVQMGFRVVGKPEVVWGSPEPTKLEGSEKTELVLGWEEKRPEDLSISQGECTGPVELVEIKVG